MKALVYSLSALSLGVAACGGGSAPSSSQPPAAPTPANSVLDGPASIAVPELTFSAAQADIDKGKAVFTSKGCVACHRPDDVKLVGPGLKGVTSRRSIKWIERMILKPEKMLAEDPTAKELLAKYFTPMANQNVNPETELPFILAYLNSLK